MTLGEVILEYRREHEMSMDKFADLSGISKAYISMLERNRTARGEEPSPSFEMFRNVARTIGVDVEDLIRRVEGKIALKPLEQLSEETAALNVLLSKIGEHIIKTEDGYFMGEAGAISEDDIQFLLNTAADSLRPAVNILIKRAEMEMKQ